MSIQNYWLEAASRPALSDIREANLEQEAQEKHMLVLDGKLVNPEDYPCDCELLDPEQCFQESKDFPDSEWSVEAYLKAQEDKTCPCPCHTYYEPF